MLLKHNLLFNLKRPCADKYMYIIVIQKGQQCYNHTCIPNIFLNILMNNKHYVNTQSYTVYMVQLANIKIGELERKAN